MTYKNSLRKTAGAVGRFLHGDDDGSLDWRYGLLGSTALSEGVRHGFANPYVNRVMRLQGAPHNLEARRMFRALAKEHKAQTGMGPLPVSSTRAYMAADEQLRGVNHLRGMVGLGPKKNMVGSHYDAGTGWIGLKRGQSGPGILAHEMGHAAGGKGLIYANAGGKAVGGIGGLLALLSPDEEKSRNAALVGSLGMAGTLASEVDASRRGYQMIRRLGGGRKAALGAFIGLPTYLAASAIPMLGHYGKKWTGGFEKKDSSK